ncbi:hypothetical protein [Metabacillus malikii]|uniref:DUF3139 domain-containing protein n=1 Tax=Metabacillus malikii TaxID=1504265 RepID=A0ABT9ZCX8_9BACI|nr:hypothetical protein [Metabacillus malikii]MDQ0229100.1 hypothetical protein [Metabacillus malikii]
MKKSRFALFFILSCVVVLFGYFHFLKMNLDNRVVEHLITEQHIPKDTIISTEPFISNLEGNKHLMVSVKLKNDDRTYFYYKGKENNIILESYTGNGTEYVQ